MRTITQCIQVENLTCAYGAKTVVHDVSLSVEIGEAVAILGSNGSGKTTLINTLAGLIRARQGKIRIFGEETQGYTPNGLVEKGVALVPEGRRLFSLMDVKTNLELGAYSIPARHRLEESIKFVSELFPVLKDKESQPAQTLSGGEQQMLAKGRALMSKPKNLLLDEPSSGLSPIMVTKIFETIRDLNERGLTLVVVEQNVARGLSVSDRTYVMANGAIALEGVSKALVNDPQMKRVYLGGSAKDSHD